uniref:Uncharacterized protein n=1 Tax=Anguilla anguilla TaxID=7936 RepID=A0A0E9RL48_ANGAN
MCILVNCTGCRAAVQVIPM